MTRANYKFTVGERSFKVGLTSDLAGYRARVMEVFSSGEHAMIELHHPPRLEIHAAEFYKNRADYLADLVKLVNAELKELRVERVEIDKAEDSDAFLGANLTGWPNGYSGAVEDNISNWHPKF